MGDAERDDRADSSVSGPLVRLAAPFRKGQSGNPGGRPKSEKAITRRARELTGPLLESLFISSERMARIAATSKDEMAAIGAHRALKDTFEVISTRAYGRPREKPAVDATAEDDGAPELLDELLTRLMRRAQAAAPAPAGVTVEGAADRPSETGSAAGPDAPGSQAPPSGPRPE